MRLIDADALIHELNNSHYPGAPYIDAGISIAIGKVCDALTIDQEIIVCADCKHWICHDRRCGYWNHGVKPLDWCSYAERRTDG